MARTTVPGGTVDRATPPSGRTWPVTAYLYALILVILVPLLIVALVLINRTNDAQQEVVVGLTNATVQAIGQSIDREISGMITTLRVLSTSPSVRQADLAGLYEGGVSALSDTGAYLLACDENLQLLVDTRSPFGAALGPNPDAGTAARTIERNLPTISSLFASGAAEAPVYNVWLPIQTTGQIRAVALTQYAAGLMPALQSRQLPTAWQAAVIDESNSVIVATPASGLDPGAILPFRQNVDVPQGEWAAETIDGQQVVTAEWRSGLTGWRVVAWAAASSVQRPLAQSVLQLGAWGVAIALVAAAVATLIANRIGKSVRGLRLDATRLGRGELIYPRTYPVAEVADISAALAEASELRQAAERDNRFLMRELAHRSKNQMAVINAMAKQTARGATDVPSYVAALEKRIMGLARSTDLLLAHGRAGVMLRDLVDLQLGPFLPRVEEKRVSIEGPALRINPQGAQILGMALHELATNAVRYGAFAGFDGKLNVSWVVNTDELVLTWRESVPGIVVVDTGRTGFGTIVLRTMVGGALGAQVNRVAHEDGVEWIFHVPLSALDPDFAAERPDEVQQAR
jgi:two-component sensor histidine kinase